MNNPATRYIAYSCIRLSALRTPFLMSCNFKGVDFAPVGEKQTSWIWTSLLTSIRVDPSVTYSTTASTVHEGNRMEEAFTCWNLQSLIGTLLGQLGPSVKFCADHYIQNKLLYLLNSRVSRGWDKTANNALWFSAIRESGTVTLWLWSRRL